MVFEAVITAVDPEIIQVEQVCREERFFGGKILIYQIIGDRHRVKREPQGDALGVLLDTNNIVIGVADSMSNPPGGDVISKFVIDELLRSPQSGFGILDNTQEFLNNLNSRIHDNRGTTLLAVEIQRELDQFIIRTLGIGDGEILVFTNGERLQLNYDTSFLGILARRVHYICNHDQLNIDLPEEKRIELESFAQRLKVDFERLLIEQKHGADSKAIKMEVEEKMKNYEEIFSLLKQIDSFKHLSSMLTFCIGGSASVTFDESSPIPPEPMGKSLNINLLKGERMLESGDSIIIHSDGLRVDIELFNKLQRVWATNESPDFQTIEELLSTYAKETGDDTTFVMVQLD